MASDPQRTPHPVAPAAAPLGSPIFFAVLGLWFLAFCAGVVGSFLLATMAGYASDRVGNNAALETLLLGAAIGWFIFSLAVPFVFAVRIMRGKSGWLAMASPVILLALTALALLAAR